MKKYSILLVDDEKSILLGIGDLLKDEGYKVVTAQSGNEGIKLLSEKMFHLVITDLIMPGKNGLDILEEVKNLSLEASVIILTGYGSLSSAIEALRLGASDYIVKPCKAKELISRVSNTLGKLSLRIKQKSGATDPPSFSLWQSNLLTKREREVCLFVREGASDEEISRKLFISSGTTKTHLKAIFKKLGVHTRGKLVALLNK